MFTAVVSRGACYGVQFHPESILTRHGHDLLNNFLKRLPTAA
jgi:anthranilate synthase component 2